ncbi:hypothetical protein, partial [Escherichia coli]|uniref:hypothetical protein n=1 Tax=Escherichia coli TaxID=562 RepID=UPI001302333E
MLEATWGICYVAVAQSAHPKRLPLPVDEQRVRVLGGPIAGQVRLPGVDAQMQVRRREGGIAR